MEVIVYSSHSCKNTISPITYPLPTCIALAPLRNNYPKTGLENCHV